MKIEIPVEQFTSKLERKGVEVREDGGVVELARIEGQLHLLGIAAANTENTTYMNYEDGASGK